MCAAAASIVIARESKSNGARYLLGTVAIKGFPFSHDAVAAATGSLRPPPPNIRRKATTVVILKCEPHLERQNGQYRRSLMKYITQYQTAKRRPARCLSRANAIMTCGDLPPNSRWSPGGAGTMLSAVSDAERPGRTGFDLPRSFSDLNGFRMIPARHRLRTLRLRCELASTMETRWTLAWIRRTMRPAGTVSPLRIEDEEVRLADVERASFSSRTARPHHPASSSSASSGYRPPGEAGRAAVHR